MSSLILTKKQFQAILPGISSVNVEKYFPFIESSLNSASINTKSRVAHFISQVGHESSSLNTVEENLNYSAIALSGLFSKYFKGQPQSFIDAYARKPILIANRVYSSRYGNGDELSGDGWKFHGRGGIQVTFKDNYKSCSEYIFHDDRLLSNPEILLQPQYVILSACWFWSANSLNKVADIVDPSVDVCTLITKRVNGGNNGILDRKNRLSIALKNL